MYIQSFVCNATAMAALHAVPCLYGAVLKYHVLANSMARQSHASCHGYKWNKHSAQQQPT
jgi:hypothetical protein